ncbi:MAG: lipid-A-disaccharide synthase, partial [Planctomycetes bacterium]|nr:lipid-A-disaccharide synthase [Planctomycetota bacterium]
TNLIAGKQVFPEYCFGEEGPLKQVARDMEAFDRPGETRETCLHELDRVRERLGPPGAASRASAAILGFLAGRSRT